MLSKIISKLRTQGPMASIGWIYSHLRLRYVQNFRRRRLDYQGLAPKLARQVFLFSAVPFYDIGGGQRSAQLARAFTQAGFAVHYIYVFPSADDKKNPNIKIPAITHRYVKDYNMDTFMSSVRANDLAIFELPHEILLPFLKASRQCLAKIIYESIDNWEAVLGSRFFSRTTAQKFVETADLLSGTSRALVAQLQEYGGKKKEIIYSPNAVNTELFSMSKKFHRPKDLISGKPTLLYYGTLDGEWFDWELVWGTANMHPDCTINLIGDYKNIPDHVKNAPPNVYFLGGKPQTSLPGYLQHCDVAILPFLIDDTVQFVSPLKIFEYIAMGKTVISTCLPDILKYPNVYTSNTQRGWTKLLSKKPRVNMEKAQAFIKDNTWSARAKQLLRSLH